MTGASLFQVCRLLEDQQVQNSGTTPLGGGLAAVAVAVAVDAYSAVMAVGREEVRVSLDAHSMEHYIICAQSPALNENMSSSMHSSTAAALMPHSTMSASLHSENTLDANHIIVGSSLNTSRYNMSAINLCDVM